MRIRKAFQDTLIVFLLSSQVSWAGGQISVQSSWINAGPSTTVTNFTPFQSCASGGTWVASETGVFDVIPVAGTFSYLLVKFSSGTVPGGTATYAFTVRKNSANTSLTCTVTSAASSCSDTSDSFSVVAGDTVTFQSVPTNTPIATGVLTWSTKFTANATNTSFVTEGVNAFAVSSIGNNFLSLQGSGQQTTTEANVSMIMPTAGTFKNLYVFDSVAAGAGQTYTITLDTNSVASPLTCAISGASAISCNDTTHSVSVVAGSTVTINFNLSATAATTGKQTVGIEFDPTNDGESLGMVDSRNTEAQSSNLFGTMTGGVLLNATENIRQWIVPACTVKNLYVRTTGIASGQTFTATLKKNTVAQSLTAAVTGAASDNQDTTHSFTTADNDLLSLNMVTSATSGTVRQRAGIVYFIATPSGATTTPLRTLLGVGQ